MTSALNIDKNDFKWLKTLFNLNIYSQVEYSSTRTNIYEKKNQIRH